MRRVAGTEQMLLVTRATEQLLRHRHEYVNLGAMILRLAQTRALAAARIAD